MNNSDKVPCPLCDGSPDMDGTYIHQSGIEVEYEHYCPCCEGLGVIDNPAQEVEPIDECKQCPPEGGTCGLCPHYSP